MSLFSKSILLINLGYLTDILMCFFLGKFISEIPTEYSQKSEKFSKSLYAHSASRNPRTLDYFEIELI